MLRCGKNEPCRIFFPSKDIKIRKGEVNDDLEIEDIEGVEDLLEIDASQKKDLDLIEAIAEGRCPENILRYTQQHYEFPVPFTMYADFESFIDENDVHVVSGFCTLLTSKFDFLNDEVPFCYSGPEPLKHFFEHLSDVRGKIESILAINHPMDPLTDEERLAHDQATHCRKCSSPFTPLNRKVHHHCHVTSSYLGATCNTCNLKLKPRKFSKAQRRDINEYVEGEMKELFILIFFRTCEAIPVT